MGSLTAAQAKLYIDLTREVPGDFVEIGVFRGDSFQHIVRLAQERGVTAHAFDSFEGMAEPQSDDGGYYPKGKLSVGGVEQFHRGMRKRGVPQTMYRVWPGFVPQCFQGFDRPVAFAFLDVDQCSPTAIALDWIWPRLSVGGVLVCDDYFPNRGILASKAIDVWMGTHAVPVELAATHVMMRKLW